MDRELTSDEESTGEGDETIDNKEDRSSEDSGIGDPDEGDGSVHMDDWTAANNLFYADHGSLYVVHMDTPPATADDQSDGFERMLGYPSSSPSASNGSLPGIEPAQAEQEEAAVARLITVEHGHSSDRVGVPTHAIPAFIVEDHIAVPDEREVRRGDPVRLDVAAEIGTQAEGECSQGMGRAIDK